MSHWDVCVDQGCFHLSTCVWTSWLCLSIWSAWRCLINSFPPTHSLSSLHSLALESFLSISLSVLFSPMFQHLLYFFLPASFSLLFFFHLRCSSGLCCTGDGGGITNCSLTHSQIQLSTLNSFPPVLFCWIRTDNDWIRWWKFPKSCSCRGWAAANKWNLGSSVCCHR